MSNYAEIKVYNKLNELIAVFNNDKNASSDEAMKNMLSNPIIHNVSNGECTLTFNILSTSQKWRDVNDAENEWHCDGKVFTMIGEENITYVGDLVTAVLYERQNLLYKEYIQVHDVDTEVEAMDIHTVKILPRTDSKYKLTINGTVYDDSVVKDSRGVLMPRGSAGYALWSLIKGNKRGWTMGICDLLPNDFDASKDIGSYNLESDMETLLDNIYHVRELWGGILIFDSLNKIIHLRDETLDSSDFNTWTGFSVYEGKNMLEKPQIKVDNNIVTKAYPLGNGNINIKSVNDDIAYIENYSYTTEVYEGYIQNENIHYTGNENTSGQEQLKAWGERELAKLCKPRTTYVISIVDRRNEDAFSHETFDLNDVIRIYYHDESTDEYTMIEQRVIDIQYDVFSRYDCSVILGDKILNNIEIFELMYENSVEDAVLPDWNGNYNAENIIINIPDNLGDWYGGYGSTSLANATSLYAEKITDNTSSIAEVYVYADETFATVVSFTEFQKETDDKFSYSYTQIEQISDELSAQINLEAYHYSELKDDISTTTQSVASLKLYADSTYATVTAVADFKKSTTESFSQSTASITALSNELSAQINLEANHYSETKDSIKSSNASISAVSDSLSAQINLEARHYSETKNSITSNYASIKAYADDKFATASMLASTNNSLASVTATANEASTSVQVVAKRTEGINNNGGYLRVDSTSFFAGVYGSGNYVSVVSTGVYIHCNSDSNIHIKGKKVSWTSSGYLKGE